MGQKLSAYYAEAQKIGAANGRIRLCMLTKTTTDQAALLPDSPELIQHYEAVMRQLREEYKNNPAKK